MMPYVAYCSLHMTCINSIIYDNVCEYTCICAQRWGKQLLPKQFCLADCLTNKQRSENEVNFECSQDNSTKESKAKS